MVVFETSGPFPDSWPVLTSWRGSVCHGSNHAAIRKHLDAKVKAYKVPLLVALDFCEPYSAFRNVVGVLIGQPVMRIPVAPDPDRETPQSELGRADDGLVLDRGASGERARSGLQAVPFYLSTSDDGSFSLSAQVVANPAIVAVSTFSSFAPIHRLVVANEADGARTMRRVDERGNFVDSKAKWTHVP